MQAAEASNAPFTADEQAEISDRLDEIKRLMLGKFKLTDQHLSAIDQRLDEVKAASSGWTARTGSWVLYGGAFQPDSQRRGTAARRPDRPAAGGAWYRPPVQHRRSAVDDHHVAIASTASIAQDPKRCPTNQRLARHVVSLSVLAYSACAAISRSDTPIATVMIHGDSTAFLYCKITSALIVTTVCRR